MNKIRKLIRESLKEVFSNILNESSAAFAAKLNPAQIAEGDKFVNSILAKGKDSNFNINYVDYTGSEGQGTKTGNVFDYTIEKCIEIYKTTSDEAIKNNIVDCIKFAYIIPPQANSAFLTVILRRAKVPMEKMYEPEESEKIRDAVKDVYLNLIAMQIPKLLGQYTRSGSFTGLIMTVYANGLHDQYYRYKDLETKISLDQPVNSNPEADDSRTMADFISGDEEKQFGSNEVKNFKKGTLDAIDFLKANGEEVVGLLLYEIVILGRSPEDITYQETFSHSDVENPFYGIANPNVIATQITNFMSSTSFPIYKLNRMYMKYGFSKTIKTPTGFREVPTIDITKWSLKDFYNPTKELSTKHVSGVEAKKISVSSSDAEALSAYDLDVDDYLEARQSNSTIRNVYDYIKMKKGTAKKKPEAPVTTSPEERPEENPEQGEMMAESYKKKIKTLEYLQEIHLRKVLKKLIKN